MIQQTIATVTSGCDTFELVRMNDDYMLFHQSPLGTAKIAITRGAIRELGSAMLVEGASREFIGG